MTEWTARQARESVDKFLYNKNRDLINRCLEIIKAESLNGKESVVLPISQPRSLPRNPWAFDMTIKWNQDAEYVINYLIDLGYKIRYESENNPDRFIVKVLY